MSPFSTTALLTLLPLLAKAAPTSGPNYPPHSQSFNFNLIANVTNPLENAALDINNYILTSYHLSAGIAYAVLIPNTPTPNPGRVFYVNGTATDVRYHTSNILSDSGSPPNVFPSGLSILPANTSSETGTEKPVAINAGIGQAGLGLATFPDPIPALYAGGLGDGRGFYACEKALPFGSAVQLFFKDAGETIAEGCVDVTLLPQCSAGVVGGVDEFTNLVNCYENVAGIDWSGVYSS